MSLTTTSAPASAAITGTAPSTTTQPAPTSGQNVPTQLNANQSAGSPPKDSQSIAREAPASPEFFEVKVNGQTRKVTKDEALRLAQLGYSATERFEAAAAEKKAAQAILTKAKSDPIGALMEAGLTEDEAREHFEAWYSAKYIEPEALTPEQRKLKDTEARLKKYEKMEAEFKAKQQAEKDEEELSVHRDLLQKQIMEIIEAHKLPKTKFTVSRIAFYMKQARDKGFEAPPELIAQQVQSERSYLNQDIPEGADYQTLVGIYGEDVVKRIISEHLKFIRTKRGSAPAKEIETPQQSQAKLSMREVDERLKQMMGRS